MTDAFAKAIEKRYSGLAPSGCCLSCGGALLFSDPMPGEVGVDLGSGRGDDVLKIAGYVGENGFAYGIDIAEEMLHIARSRAKGQGVRNVKFIRSTLENISLQDGTADFVVSNCTINHSLEKDLVWNEVYRILKSGGRFVVSDIYALERVPGEYQNDPQAVAECWAGAVQKGDYLETVDRAGFRNIAILEESLAYEKGKIKVASFTLYGEKCPNKPVGEEHMKTLISRKKGKKKDVAQCCAKISSVKAGCHD
jgi:SAM-dependent methyltransferase